jgi:hypothetical protein
MSRGHENQQLEQKSYPESGPGQRLLWGLSGAMLVIYVAALVFGPIVRGDDIFAAFAHLDAWIPALRDGSFLAVWTPLEANGFGSPMPFFYHKLFNWIAALLALSTGDVVTAFRLTLLFFSGVMFAGAYRCAVRFELDPLSRFLTATACVLSPYAVSNVVERDAVAEYAAMALIPWVLAVVADIHLGVRRAWHLPALSVLLALLALAHVLIFVVTIALLGALAILLILREKKGGWVLAGSLAVVVSAFIGLIYVPFTYWATYFCPGQARVFGTPGDNVIPWSVIGLPIPQSRVGWLGAALLIALPYFTRRRSKAKTNDFLLGLGMVALLLVVAITPASKPFWALSSRFDIIQFPMRLLTVATPMAVVSLFGLMETLDAKLRRRLQFDLLLVAMFNLAVMVALLGGRGSVPIPEAVLQSPILRPDGFGEYFPSMYQERLSHLSPQVLVRNGAAVVLPPRRPLVEANGCSYKDIGRPDYFDRLSVLSECDGQGWVRINQFATPFVDAQATSNSGAIVKALGNTEMVEFLLPRGQWTITVKSRGYTQLVEMAWIAILKRHAKT